MEVPPDETNKRLATPEMLRTLDLKRMDMPWIC